MLRCRGIWGLSVRGMVTGKRADVVWARAKATTAVAVTPPEGCACAGVQAHGDWPKVDAGGHSQVVDGPVVPGQGQARPDSGRIGEPLGANEGGRVPTRRGGESSYRAISRRSRVMKVTGRARCTGRLLMQGRTGPVGQSLVALTPGLSVLRGCAEGAHKVRKGQGPDWVGLGNLRQSHQIDPAYAHGLDEVAPGKSTSRTLGRDARPLAPFNGLVDAEDQRPPGARCRSSRSAAPGPPRADPRARLST